MSLPNDSLEPNVCIKNVKARNKRKIPSKIASPKYKIIASFTLLSDEEEENERKVFATKDQNEKIIIKPFVLLPNSIDTSSPIISLISEDEDEEEKEINIATTSKLGDKSDETKISGTDFDSIKKQWEMMGLKLTSENSKNYLFQNTESFTLNQQIKCIETATGNIYESNDHGLCNVHAISFVTEDNICEFIRHGSPKLLNLVKPDELPRVISYTAQEEVVEENSTMKLFVSNNNNMYSFENNGMKVDENLKIFYEIKNPIPHNQSEIKPKNSHNSIISDFAVNTLNIKEIEQHSQDEYPKVNVSNLKEKVSDSFMKPPEFLPNNILSMPEANELNGNDNIVDEDDDDPFKLVIVENDEIETDYQTDAYIGAIGEELNSSNEHVEAQCQIFQNYSHNKNHSSRNRLYMDNIDNNTKSPTINNREIVKSAAKLFNNKSLNNEKPKQIDFEVENAKVKYKKQKTMALSEVPCSEVEAIQNPLHVFAQICCEQKKINVKSV